MLKVAREPTWQSEVEISQPPKTKNNTRTRSSDLQCEPAAKCPAFPERAWSCAPTAPAVFFHPARCRRDHVPLGTGASASRLPRLVGDCLTYQGTRLVVELSQSKGPARRRYSIVQEPTRTIRQCNGLQRLRMAIRGLRVVS
jgi:hypothetical protein